MGFKNSLAVQEKRRVRAIRASKSRKGDFLSTFIFKVGLLFDDLEIISYSLVKKIDIFHNLDNAISDKSFI